MLSGLLGAILPVANTVIDRLVPDKNAQAKLKAEMEKTLVQAEAAGMLAQAQANVESAKSSHLFVSGARPAIMWICALGLFTNFFLMPIAEWITTIWLPDVILPELKTDELMGLTLSLLGLGGMRSWEKSKGVARENLK